MPVAGAIVWLHMLCDERTTLYPLEPHRVLPHAGRGRVLRPNAGADRDRPPAGTGPVGFPAARTGRTGDSARAHPALAPTPAVSPLTTLGRTGPAGVPRQRPVPRPAPRLGRTRLRAHDPLHGRGDRHPSQPFHP